MDDYFYNDVADVAALRRALRSGYFRHVRREVDATQSEWAVAADCSESEVSRAERGLLVPRHDLAVLLARVLRSAILGLEASRPTHGAEAS